MPMAFCLEVKVQLSVPVHCKSPRASSSIRYPGVDTSSLRGGDNTYAAACLQKVW